MLAFFNCLSLTMRILMQTVNTAVIQRIAATKFEAKAKAMTRTKELFGRVRETNEAECTQEYQMSGSPHGSFSGTQQGTTTGIQQKYFSSNKKGYFPVTHNGNVSGSTYYNCGIQVERIVDSKIDTKSNPKANSEINRK